MQKYIVETFYTCAFKIIHKLDELNEKNLSDLENRKDGEVQIIDVKLNNRKTKIADNKKNTDNAFDKCYYGLLSCIIAKHGIIVTVYKYDTMGIPSKLLTTN